jgi:hypothetical protein
LFFASARDAVDGKHTDTFSITHHNHQSPLSPSLSLSHTLSPSLSHSLSPSLSHAQTATTTATTTTTSTTATAINQPTYSSTNANNNKVPLPLILDAIIDRYPAIESLLKSSCLVAVNLEYVDRKSMWARPFDSHINSKANDSISNVSGEEHDHGLENKEPGPGSVVWVSPKDEIAIIPPVSGG